MTKNPKTHDHEITPLHLAARNGHFDVCRLILEKVAVKNPAAIDGLTPLHNAAKGGHLDICRLILEDENVGIKNPAAIDGLTPLHSAAKGGQLDILKLLVGSGVDKRPLFNRRTPLEEATSNGHLKSCMFLIRNWHDFQQFWKYLATEPFGLTAFSLKGMCLSLCICIVVLFISILGTVLALYLLSKVLPLGPKRVN